jgi:hypothetical protein
MLLAGGEHLGPVRDLAEPAAKVAKRDGVQRGEHGRVTEIACLAGI